MELFEEIGAAIAIIVTAIAGIITAIKKWKDKK